MQGFPERVESPQGGIWEFQRELGPQSGRLKLLDYY